LLCILIIEYPNEAPQQPAQFMHVVRIYKKNAMQLTNEKPCDRNQIGVCFLAKQVYVSWQLEHFSAPHNPTIGGKN